MYRLPVAGVIVLGLALGLGCAHGAAPPRPSRTLSPDSLALLREALRHVRPAFATQDEALRAGIYLRSTLAAEIARSDHRAPLPQAEGADAAGLYVIQIAAYRARHLAEHAADDAQRRFPGTVAIVEAAGEMYRVALAGWQSATAAQGYLPSVQRIYPGAWVRRRAVS